MSKKNMKLGVASALAIGAGAAIVAKKSKKSETDRGRIVAEEPLRRPELTLNPLLRTYGQRRTEYVA